MKQDIFEEPKSDRSKVFSVMVIFALVLVFGASYFGTDSKGAREYNPNAPNYYNTAGRVYAPVGARVAIFDDYITPGSAMGNTIDYSSAHFIAAPIITITAEQNTSSITNIPMVSIATKTASSCTVNILTSNTQVVSILGSTVTGLVAATNLSTMKLHIRAKGYTLDAY